MRPSYFIFVVVMAVAAGCATQGGHSSYERSRSFHRDVYFVTTREVQSELAAECRQRHFVVTEHPTGIIAHLPRQPGHEGADEVIYVVTVVDTGNDLRMWSYAEFPYDESGDEAEVLVTAIESAVEEKIRTSGPPDESYFQSISPDEKPSVARIDLQLSAQLAPLVGDIITLRGPTERRKNGIYMIGSDVLVQLPQWCDTQNDEPQWSASVKGRLRLIREAGMYHSVNESRQPGDPLVQDLASGPMPALYELVP